MKQMAHRHPDFPHRCTIEEPPRSLSEWLVLGVCAVVLAGVVWALLWLLFVGLGAS